MHLGPYHCQVRLGKKKVEYGGTQLGGTILKGDELLICSLDLEREVLFAGHPWKWSEMDQPIREQYAN